MIGCRGLSCGHALLYRDIRSIGKISTVLWIGLMVAMGIIIWGGAWHFQPKLAFQFPARRFHFSPAFFAGLGAATLISMYDFSGYFTVCLIGGEIKNPTSNIPRAILLSIGILAVLYIAMSLSIIGVIPWQEAAHSQAIISDFMAHLYGPKAAAAMTVLILWVAFASVFCVLLGYTTGAFCCGRRRAVLFRFRADASNQALSQRSPCSSWAWLSAAACLLSLEQLIKDLIVVQIVTQFAAQCMAWSDPALAQGYPRPFSMPLYPLPVIIALAGWLYILFSVKRNLS